MRLDRAAAEAAIRRDVAAPLGHGVEAAAAAIVELATEHMVQAILDITVNQGIDPAEAAFVAGGGAAGLNCVAIARRLGCRGVLVPETAAALAAAGRPDLRPRRRTTRPCSMRRAEASTRRGQRASLARSRGALPAPSAQDGSGCDLRRHRLDDGGSLSRPSLGNRGAPAAARVRRSRRCRRAGRGLPPHASGDLRRQRSGFADRDGRLERGGALPDRQRRSPDACGRPTAASRSRRRPAYLPGAQGCVDVGCLPFRGDPAAMTSWSGRRSSSPSFTSIVIDPGAIARRDDPGTLVIDVRRRQSHDATRHRTIDGVAAGDPDGRASTASRERWRTRCIRTGRSGILTIAHDFSCVVLTAEHELLAAADSLPIHVLRGPEIMTRTMTDNHPGPEARRRVPAQFALSWLHPSGRSLDPGPGHRRRGRAPLHGARQGPPGRLRQLRCRPPTWARPRTFTPKAR